MLARTVESHYTVMRSKNFLSDRSSGSRIIIMDFISNSLVGHVNFTSPMEVNFQGSSYTYAITDRQQYMKTVLF